MWLPAVVKAEWQRPATTCVYKPGAANTVLSSWWWAVCRSKHVEPLINFGIINSITSCILLVFLLNHPRCTDPWISNLLLYWHYAALCGRRVWTCFQAIIRSSRENTCEIMYTHCVGIQRLVSAIISDKVTTCTVALILWIAKVTGT